MHTTTFYNFKTTLSVITTYEKGFDNLWLVTNTTDSSHGTPEGFQVSIYCLIQHNSSVGHGCDKPQGYMATGMAGWGQGMKISTCKKPQPLWQVYR